jgi:AI-2 transport protein TqsA
MTDPSNSQRGIRFLVIVAALVIIIGGINQAQSVLVSFLVAVFLAILGTPPVLWLERRRIPTVAATLIVVTGMVSVMLIVGGLVATSLNNFIEALPTYQQRIQEEVSALKALLATKGIRVTDKVLLEYINPGVVIKLSVSERYPDLAYRNVYIARSLKLPWQAPRCPRRSSSGISPVHEVR